MGPMNVLLDGERVMIARPTLAAALAAGVAKAEASGRIIITAAADGQPLTEEELTSPSDEETGLAEVTLTTAEPRTLVRVTLFDAADVMETLAAEQKEVGVLIQAGKVAEASKQLAQVFGAWQSVCDVVAQSSEVLGRDLSTLTLRDGEESITVGGQLAATMGTLGGVRDAIRAGDWAALGDAMTYELPPLAGQWRRTLRLLAEVVGGPGGTLDGSDAQAQRDR